MEALNKTSPSSSLTPITSVDDVRDGKILSAIIEKFEAACGRKRRPKEGNYYQFIEDWLVTIGNLSYIPHYGKFVKHILLDCELELISNIFGIVAITMYNNRNDLWNVLNIEIFFLLFGEPFIPKIIGEKNKEIHVERDEKYSAIVENRQLQRQLEQTKKKFAEELARKKEEIEGREESHERVMAMLNLKISANKKKVAELEKTIAEMKETIKRLEDENRAKLEKIESLKDIIIGNDAKTLVSTTELNAIKQKVVSMQDQMKQITLEMDEKLGAKK